MSMQGIGPQWIGWKVPGDGLVFWWPADSDADTYDADQARALDMALHRYRQLHGDGKPDTLVLADLAMVTDLNPDD